VANGGWGGSIQYRGLVETLQRGYATASTDTGHTEPGGSWAIGHPEKVEDYGGRAIHETTAKAKAIATAFYGKAPAASFMTGCSLGGLQALKQAEFLRQVYAGPVYQSTGESINPGPLVGNESTWSFTIPPKPPGVAVDLFRYLVFEDPAWDFDELDYDKDIVLTEKKVAPVINAENPDLSAYFDRGGKLMMYIGSYEHTNYTAHLGYVDEMYHCAGGIGADTFDKLGAIERWHETGKAPDVIEASQVKDGKVVFTRPLCAYPKTARYSGSGDPSKAESFSCR
jgi:feruloyl esterase